MRIRAARQEDACAMGQVMVATYLAAHRHHMPAEAWEKRVREWTAEVSAQNWARDLHAIATGKETHACIYVAEEDGEVIGLAMGGPANEQQLLQVGEVYLLYVQESHQGRGIGRHLTGAVAAHLAKHGMTTLHIACLASNTPGRRFYEALGGQVVAERLFD